MSFIATLRSKIHRATVSSVDVNYEGSCLIDEILLDAAHIQEYEQIHIYNITNGQRFTTYAMKSKIRGLIQLCGGAAHKAKPGDKIIICTYHYVNAEVAIPHPFKVFVEEQRNEISQYIDG